MNILILVFIAAVFAIAEAQTPRQVGLVVAEDSAGVQSAALTIDEIEGVLAIELNIVLDADRVSVLAVQPTDLLPGFFAFHNVVDDTLKFAAASTEAALAGRGVFAELFPETVDGPPELHFALVSLNDDEIPVYYEPRYEVPIVVLSATSRSSPVQLAQNYPNPFNAETTIAFTLVESTPVELAIYNTAGQWVRTLVAGKRGPGIHRLIWNGKDHRGRRVASGRYVVRLAGEGFVRETAMTVLK